MHTISLYRIMKCKTNRYRVGQCYTIHTEQPCNVPPNYEKSTSYIHPQYADWFQMQVFPLLEMHNGDRIIEKWAVPEYENPEHVTIAISVGNTLVCPDLLANTTSFESTTEDEVKVWNHVEHAIQRYHHC